MISAQDLFDSIRRYTIATDTDELPEDFPLRTFVDLMGQYGDVDPEMYERVRNEQATKLAERKAELAAKEAALVEGESATESPAQEPATEQPPAMPSPAGESPAAETPAPQPQAEVTEVPVD